MEFQAFGCLLKYNINRQSNVPLSEDFTSVKVSLKHTFYLREDYEFTLKSPNVILYLTFLNSQHIPTFKEDKMYTSFSNNNQRKSIKQATKNSVNNYVYKKGQRRKERYYQQFNKLENM